MKKTVFLYILVVFSSFCIGQENTHVQVDSIIGLIQYEVMPQYNGNLAKFIKSETDYSNLDCDNIKDDFVIVQFKIDTLANTSNFDIIKSLGKPYDNEALRVAKEIRFESPAYSLQAPIETSNYMIRTYFNTKDYKRKKKITSP